MKNNYYQKILLLIKRYELGAYRAIILPCLFPYGALPILRDGEGEGRPTNGSAEGGWGCPQKAGGRGRLRGSEEKGGDWGRPQRGLGSGGKGPTLSGHVYIYIYTCCCMVHESRQHMRVYILYSSVLDYITRCNVEIHIYIYRERERAREKEKCTYTHGYSD